MALYKLYHATKVTSMIDRRKLPEEHRYEQQTEQSTSLQLTPQQAPFPRETPLRVVAFVAFPYYLNHTNTRRARHVPEQT